MLRVNFLSLLGLIPFLALSFGQNLAAEERPVVSQNQFLGQVANTHPLFAKENLNLDIAKQDLQSTKGGKDWNLELYSQYAKQDELIVNSGPDEIDSTLVGARVNKQVWSTGGIIGIGAELSASDFENVPCVNPAANPPETACLFPSTNTSDSNQIDITYSQPLLNNFMGKQSTLAYELNELGLVDSEVSAKESQEQFLSTVGAEYLDWVLLVEQTNINNRRVALSSNQRKEMEKRYKKNLVEKVDLMRLQDSEKNAQQQFLLSRSQLRGQRARLALIAQDPSINNALPGFDLYNFPALPDLNTSREALRENARNVRVLSQNIKKLERQLKSVKDETRGNLSLDLRAAVKDRTDERPNETLDDSGTDYSVGLNYSRPIGNYQKEANYQKLVYEVQQLKLERRQLQIELDASLSNLHIQISEMEDILRLNSALIETAQLKTQEELKLYKQGRSDLTNVISSRDQTQASRLVYAQNATNYHKLYLQYQALTDSLLNEVIQD